MDVWAITLAALRRWYVFLPLLAMTVLAALWVGSRAPEHYQSTSTVVLVPGAETTEIDNPYGGISETANVLEIVLGSTATRDDIEARGLSPDYVIDTRSQSRIVDLVVTGDTEELSLGTMDALIDLMGQELVTRQSAVGIPEDAQLVVQILQEPAITEVVADGQLRNMAVVGIIGAALSLLAAVLFDDLLGLGRRWVSRRRQRGSPAAMPDPDEQPTEVDDAVARRR